MRASTLLQVFVVAVNFVAAGIGKSEKPARISFVSANIGSSIAALFGPREENRIVGGLSASNVAFMEGVLNSTNKHGRAFFIVPY